MSCKLIVCKMLIKLTFLFTTFMSVGISADLCHLEGLSLSLGIVLYIITLIVFHDNFCRQMIAYLKQKCLKQ